MRSIRNGGLRTPHEKDAVLFGVLWPCHSFVSTGPCPVGPQAWPAGRKAAAWPHALQSSSHHFGYRFYAQGQEVGRKWWQSPGGDGALQVPARPVLGRFLPGPCAALGGYARKTCFGAKFVLFSYCVGHVRSGEVPGVTPAWKTIPAEPYRNEQVHHWICAKRDFGNRGFRHRPIPV